MDWLEMRKMQLESSIKQDKKNLKNLMIIFIMNFSIVSIDIYLLLNNGSSPSPWFGIGMCGAVCMYLIGEILFIQFDYKFDKEWLTSLHKIDIENELIETKAYYNNWIKRYDEEMEKLKNSQQSENQSVRQNI